MFEIDGVKEDLNQKKYNISISDLKVNKEGYLFSLHPRRTEAGRYHYLVFKDGIYISDFESDFKDFVFKNDYLIKRDLENNKLILYKYSIN